MGKNKNAKKLFFRISAAVLAVILLLIYAVMTCYYLNKIDTNDRLSEENIKFIAHRGHSALYFENTVQAFDAAYSQPFFEGIETDIWMTKDGVFVCSHDNNPFVDKSILITSSNFDDIKNLSLDTSAVRHDIDKTINYRICTLKGYLERCLASSKIALMEIKQDFTVAEVEQFLAFVSGKISHKNVFIGSFNKKVIEKIHAKAPYYKVLLFTSSATISYAYATLGYNIGVSKKSLNSSAITKAHKNSSYTFVYTLTNGELSRFADMKVDFVICDDIIA